MGRRLTDEQKAVIQHPLGKHARVLAVAGSGKTTTMVFRVKYLVIEQHVEPSRLCVLMFNSLARRDFKEKLGKLRLPPHQQPRVETFHSFCYRFINAMIAERLLPPSTAFWIGKNEELVRLTVHRAIRNLQQRGEIELDDVDLGGFESLPDSDAEAPYSKIDPGEVMEAIGLWKGSLIPPERAGYRGSQDIPRIYAEFEQLRLQEEALTFDDFIPLAIEFLQTYPEVRQRWCAQFDQLIIDEYQDVNYGQQRLLELLAAERADVMVVGDDDQTIYEWRGARSSYIIRKFQTVFSNKPHVNYTLSQSFRFGPIVAQAAHNVIEFNTNRVSKPLVAYQREKVTPIKLILDSSDQPTHADGLLADQIEALLRDERVEPGKIVVLARLFAQLSGLETELLARGIPYHVYGHQSFFARQEIVKLLNYIRFAQALEQIPSRQSEEWLLSIANTPSRKLKRELLRRAMHAARARKMTAGQALAELIDSPESTLNKFQRERVEDFLQSLKAVRARVEAARLAAGDLLQWLTNSLDYLSHFDDYYGRGEDSADRKIAVQAFLRYAKHTGLALPDFLQHLEHVNPARDAPADQQIRMTTIFRTKGLEYDYVVIPHCEEGFIPCLYDSASQVFDSKGQIQEPEPSEAVENERRLFYVGITRAKERVYIAAAARRSGGGSAKQPAMSRFLEEMQLESVSEVMLPLSRYVGGEQQAGQALVDSVRRFAGHGWVRRQLVQSYIAGREHELLTGKIATIIAATSESAFAYEQAYPPQDAGPDPQPDRASNVPF